MTGVNVRSVFFIFYLVGRVIPSLKERKITSITYVCRFILTSASILYTMYIWVNVVVAKVWRELSPQSFESIVLDCPTQSVFFNKSKDEDVPFMYVHKNYSCSFVRYTSNVSCACFGVVQGGPDTPIDFVLGNPGSGSNVGCLPSLRSSCSLVHKSETRFKALQAVHLL